MAFIDAGSAAAANAMACAAEAGFGRAYYSGLFANHTLQLERRPAAGPAPTRWGLPRHRPSTACVTGRAHEGWVDSINAAADRPASTGTPTMFLDGAPVDDHGLTPETLDRMIGDAATN